MELGEIIVKERSQTVDDLLCTKLYEWADHIEPLTSVLDLGCSLFLVPVSAWKSTALRAFFIVIVIIVYSVCVSLLSYWLCIKILSALFQWNFLSENRTETTKKERNWTREKTKKVSSAHYLKKEKSKFNSKKNQ